MEINNNASYLKGIIGGLIGGFVASIPWILTYVYGNMILSLLAIIIALGVLKGYQLFKGKIDTKLPIIIVTLSVISVSLSTLIIIPLLLLAKEGMDPSIENLQLLYETSSFTTAIIKDYVISLVFTFLGISGVVSNVKNQVNEGKTSNIRGTIENNTIYNNDDINTIKEIFIKLNAIDKYNAVRKEEIFDQITDSKLKTTFNNLRLQQIILKYRGKYYFSEQNQNSFFKRFIMLFTKIMIVIVIITAVITIFIVMYDDNDNNETNQSTTNISDTEKIAVDNIIYEIPEDWKEALKYREEDIRYYVPNFDITGYSGVISVSYGDTIYTEKEYKKFLNTIEEYVEESISDRDYKIHEGKTKKGYRTIEIEVNYDDEDPKCRERLIYIVGEESYGLVYLTDYYSEEIDDIDKITDEITDSFEWKQNNA